MTQVQMFIHN